VKLVRMRPWTRGTLSSKHCMENRSKSSPTNPGPHEHQDGRDDPKIVGEKIFREEYLG